MALLLLIVLGLSIGYLIAKEFYIIAEMKGHTERKYFWICFLLGIVGYYLVIALPDRRTVQHENKMAKTAAANELPDL